MRQPSTALQARFSTRQKAAQEARAAADAKRIDLKVRYGSTAYGSKKEQRLLERLDKAASRKANSFFKCLQQISPRRWESGVPYAWLIDSLAWDDAITDGQLAVVPPPAWGFTEHDSKLFSLPLTQRAA